jgi:hypothetical protein
MTACPDSRRRTACGTHRDMSGRSRTDHVRSDRQGTFAAATTCLNRVMDRDHRRELYSPASRQARSMSDALGPDGVRVTLRIEPAVDRLRRLRFMLTTPRVLTNPIDTYLDYRVLPDLVQKHLLHDSWAVERLTKTKQSNTPGGYTRESKRKAFASSGHLRPDAPTRIAADEGVSCAIRWVCSGNRIGPRADQSPRTSEILP